jgi:hypothetical protein
MSLKFLRRSGESSSVAEGGESMDEMEAAEREVECLKPELGGLTLSDSLEPDRLEG